MRLILAALGALTLLRLILCASLPLAPDEAYYFLWSQHLQSGYLDHPPMVALCIRAGTFLFGDTPLGIRFTGPLMAALGSVLLWCAGEDMFPHRQAGLIAAALFNATLAAAAGSVIITPDMPLLLFWTAGIAALARLIATGNPRWWLAIGLAAGLALLSKYTGLLFIVAIFIWLITAPEGRATLRTPWPWLGILVAFLAFSPDFYWNATHHWASYLKQGSRFDGFSPLLSLQYLAELVFGQLGLATPIICVLAVLGLWCLRLSPAPAPHLLIWLTIVPAVVFLEHVLSGRVELNWTAIAYPSACLAAAALPMAILRRWLKPALALGFAITALVYLQALAPFLPIPVRADPAALQLRGWPALAADAAASHPAFITSDDYATLASLAYYAPPATPVVGFGPRWATFSLPPASSLQNAPGLLITHHFYAIPECQHQIGLLTRKLGKATLQTYRVCVIPAPASAVLLPRP